MLASLHTQLTATSQTSGVKRRLAAARAPSPFLPPIPSPTSSNPKRSNPHLAYRTHMLPNTHPPTPLQLTNKSGLAPNGGVIHVRG
ncbi:hypothetical protein PTT_00233 [Pyrenophora teres f. teres 0-1]|uniref:Uncharacterized protein n=1 Tax=Pyrenophora teres f. teres (strain 0-1) TaxID=861557 RepID=E3RCC6_PYRTT|nr:hypothetical protein PTT_00233 [Pyrenophora teres f. teres 0-1]